MKSEYFIPIYVKPYVYKWLMVNYLVNVKGLRDAVSFAKDFELKSMFIALLSQKPRYDEMRINNENNLHRNKLVYVYAGERLFAHRACNMTNSAQLLFTSHLEAIIKADFVTYAGFMYLVESKLPVICERYKKMKGFTEDDWPTTSMIKILERKGVRELRHRFRENFVSLSEQFFATQVSVNNTIKRKSKHVEL